MYAYAVTHLMLHASGVCLWAACYDMQQKQQVYYTLQAAQLLAGLLVPLLLL
jgi:hypothetical protein